MVNASSKTRVNAASPTIDQKYKLTSLLGAAKGGTAYAAHDLTSGRPVELRLLDGSGVDAGAFARMLEIAQEAARTNSEHVLPMLDGGQASDGAFFVTDHLAGERLSARLAGSPRLSVVEVVSLVIQILQGLEALHGAGIVHGWLDLDSVFLAHERAGVIVKILDVGMSALDQDAKLVRASDALDFAAPERLSGHPEPRSDLYSVGMILRRLVAGALVDPHASSPEHQSLLSTVVDRAIAVDPADRYETAALFRAWLEGWLVELARLGVLVRRSSMPPSGRERLSPPPPIRSTFRPITRGPVPPEPVLPPSPPPPRFEHAEAEPTVQIPRPQPRGGSSRIARAILLAVAVIVIAGMSYFVLR